MMFVAKLFGGMTVRLIPYLLVIPIAVFYALSLASCVSISPGIPDLYIVSLQPSSNTSAPIQVRFGYFGICGWNQSTFRCQSSFGTSSDAIAANLFPSSNSTGSNKDAKSTSSAALDAQSLVATAVALQSQIFISILAGGAFLFIISLFLLLVLKRALKNPNPAKPRRAILMKQIAFGCLYLSAALTFTASLATSETAGALQYSSVAVSGSSILIRPGISLQVLQWLAFGFSVAFTLLEGMLLKRGHRGLDLEK